MKGKHSFKTKLFLKIMDQIQVGHFILVMPDGEKREYLGKTPGRLGELIIRDYAAISKIVASADIGLAEAYRDGMIESPDMTSLLLLCIENQSALEAVFRGNFFGMIYYRIRHLFRGNSRKGSKKNIEAHYDLGNNFYKLWLDPSMTYSAAIFKHADDSLEQAQKNKYQRIIDTIKPKSSDHILEVGCGWGGFATMAAIQTGCKVTCLTLSQEQYQYATDLVRKMGLDTQVTIKICDYRDEVGIYDHIVSIEMIEAVGEEYWEQYFNMIELKLRPGGKAMLQSIYIVDDLFDNYRKSTDFIQQYIFPGGMVLAPKVFEKFSVKNNLEIKDFHKFGLDYAQTLNLWRKEFKNKYEEVRKIGFDETFLKLWDFYYIYCEAGFLSRRIDVAQIVLEKR
jgi:cyclopropane-fatty-acyl-phospholipid synthase